MADLVAGVSTNIGDLETIQKGKEMANSSMWPYFSFGREESFVLFFLLFLAWERAIIHHKLFGTEKKISV